jgi:hypothetical protein
MDLQRFISGEVSMSMAYALGMLQPKHRSCGIGWSVKAR